MQTCQICDKTTNNQISWVTCPIWKKPICMDHCLSCDYFDVTGRAFKCHFNDSATSTTFSPEWNLHELTYHYRITAPFANSELEEIFELNEEFGAIRYEHSELHIRMYHKDDFVLCRAMGEIKKREAEIKRERWMKEQMELKRIQEDGQQEEIDTKK